MNTFASTSPSNASARQCAISTLATLRGLRYVPRGRGSDPAGRAPVPDAPARWLRSPRAFVLWLIIVGVIGRLVLARAIGLGVDESYQVAVSRPLSLSYFDHSPLSFWIPGVIGILAGSAGPVLLRLPFILLFAGTTWMMYRLGARLFGERAGAIAALILNITPVFSVSTGSWVLPDGPLMFWMLASALCLERVLIVRESPHDRPLSPTMWWIGAGACAGLALLSKYHGVFVLAGTGLFLLTRRNARQWLRQPGPYLGAVVAALIFSPVIVWNAQHHWISFRFQGGRGASQNGLHLEPFLQNIAGQAGYLLPWICIPLAWVLGSVFIRAGRPIEDDRGDAARWFLACLAIGPILTFTLIALGGARGLPHWQAPGWLMAIPILAAAVDARLARGTPRIQRRTWRWLLASTIAFVVLVPVAATQARSGWMERVAPALFRRGDPTLESLDWSDLAAAAAPALGTRQVTADGSAPAERPFVAATSWIDAGKIAYALGARADVVCVCDEPHQFAFIHDARSYIARDALIIERAGGKPRSNTSLARYFRSVQPLGSVVLRRGGRPAITLLLYRGAELRANVTTLDP